MVDDRAQHNVAVVIPGKGILVEVDLMTGSPVTFRGVTIVESPGGRVGTDHIVLGGIGTPEVSRSFQFDLKSIRRHVQRGIVIGLEPYRQ